MVRVPLVASLVCYWLELLVVLVVVAVAHSRLDPSSSSTTSTVDRRCILSGPAPLLEPATTPAALLTTNPRLVNSAGERVQPFSGPVAILVDALSGSASECFAGGMQSIGRVKVFGQTSMGQALPAQFSKLPNGDVLIHAFGDFVTADGTRLEGRGVIPDVPVPLTREDLLAGRDRTLDAALAWIDAARRGNSGRP